MPGLFRGFSPHDENVFVRHFESNIWECHMLLKIQWQNAVGGGGGEPEGYM